MIGNAPLSRGLYPFPIFCFQRRLSVWRSNTSIFLQSGSFSEVRMADTSKCNYPGACRIVDAYFRLNLSGWVDIAVPLFNFFAISYVLLMILFWCSRWVSSPTTVKFFLYWMLNIFRSFRRYFGIVISHFQLALYTARRDEMVEAVQSTMFYMNPSHPIPVHSTYTSQPYEVCILCLDCRDPFLMCLFAL